MKPADVKPAVEAAPVAELELKLPEGMTLDDATLASYKATAKELGLDSPKAQKLLEFQNGITAAAEKARAESYAKMEAEWTAALKSDPEIGGPAYEASEKNARLAVQKFGGQPLEQLLVAAGLANHPTLVKTFARIGKAMSDDSVAGSSSTGAAPSAEADLAALFPTMFPNH